MKLFLSFGILLFCIPAYILSQEKQIVWEYHTPYNKAHIIDLKKIEKIVFFNDNSFESITLDPGHIGGKGTYVIQNSIVKCTYNGEISESKGFVAIDTLVANSEYFKVAVKNYEGENLLGANITLKSDQNLVLNTIHTDFYGVALVPKKNLSKITIDFIAYKSISIDILKNNTPNLNIVLGTCCPKSIIAKGSEQRFEIVTNEDNKSTLKLLDSNRILYNN